MMQKPHSELMELLARLPALLGNMAASEADHADSDEPAEPHQPGQMIVLMLTGDKPAKKKSKPDGFAAGSKPSFLPADEDDEEELDLEA